MGNLLSPGDRFSAHLVLPNPEKSHKYEDFPRFHEWPRTCNNTESSGHREGSARRIRLIPRVVKQDQNSVAYPLFGGRRIYVSFVWTIHGGSCCYCSYPASRSLCCLSLSLTVLSLRTWFPHRPNLSSGKIEVEVRQSLASFLLIKLCSPARGGPPPPGWNGGCSRRIPPPFD